MVIHETFADFVLFLYIHMAHADGEYHTSEQEVILAKVPKLFPTEGDPKGKMKSALSAYKSVNEVDFKGIIHDTFKHFDKVKFSQKYKVYTDMFDIVNADGKVHETEQRALNELKDIINAGADASRQK